MANRVGYNPHDKVSGSLEFNDAVVAGMLVGATTRFLLQPFDVWKIRYQLQVENKSAAKYKSFNHLVRTIAAEEGLMVFWKGHMTGQYLSMLYLGIQFSLNEVLTKRLYNHFPVLQKQDADAKLLALAHSACGAPGAICGTLASYPFDVLRTRKIAQLSSRDNILSNKMYYTTTWDSAKLIWKLEGPTAFFQGATPQLVSMGLFSALAFGFYEFLTQTCYKADLNTYNDPQTGQKYLGFYSKCLCSTLSGIFAKTATYPLDTVRRRLQVQGFRHGRRGMGLTPKYSGMTDCFVKILRYEKFSGFFKGLVPGTVKAAVSTLIYFQLYEVFKLKISEMRLKQREKV